jgi:hypothetical protein
MRNKIGAQDTGKHECAAHQRVQQVFIGCVFLAPTSPDEDEEEHRYQLQLPEEEEEDEIEGAEHAEYAAFQQEYLDKILLGL